MTRASMNLLVHKKEILTSIALVRYVIKSYHKIRLIRDGIFFNVPPQAPFSLFLVFSNKKRNFVNKLMWKISNMWYWDSNPRPLEHESSPLSTSPGPPGGMFDKTFSCEIMLL